MYQFDPRHTRGYQNSLDYSLSKPRISRKKHSTVEFPGHVPRNRQIKTQRLVICAINIVVSGASGNFVRDSSGFACSPRGTVLTRLFSDCRQCIVEG